MEFLLTFFNASGSRRSLYILLDKWNNVRSPPAFPLSHGLQIFGPARLGSQHRVSIGEWQECNPEQADRKDIREQIVVKCTETCWDNENEAICSYGADQILSGMISMKTKDMMAAISRRFPNLSFSLSKISS